MSDPRYVIVHIDDPDVNEIGVQPLDLDAGVAHSMYYVPVPPDDQIVRDVDEVTAGLDKLVNALKAAPGSRTDNTAIHEATARLRAAFGLGEEEI